MSCGGWRQPECDCETFHYDYCDTENNELCATKYLANGTIVDDISACTDLCDYFTMDDYIPSIDDEIMIPEEFYVWVCYTTLKDQSVSA